MKPFNIKKSTQAVIKENLHRLSPSERWLAYYRFIEDKTLDEIAKEFAVTRERIRKILERIIPKLERIIPGKQ